MFLRVLLVCIFSSYILDVASQPLKGSDAVSKKCPYQNETFEEKWAKFTMDFIRLIDSNVTLFENWKSWISPTSGLQEEFLTMVDGFHFKFPLSEKNETDQQHKIISIAVSKLLMNLRTMQRAHEVVINTKIDLILNNTELFLRSKFDKGPSEAIMRTLLEDFFTILNCQIETDKELRGEYKKTLDEGGEIVKKDPKMCGPLINKVREEFSRTGDVSLEGVMKLFEDKRTFRRSYLNDLFREYSNDRIEGIFSSPHHEPIERYSLPKALIRKAVASSSSESKVNDLYQRALIEAEEEMTNQEAWINVIKESLGRVDEKIEQGLTNEVHTWSHGDVHLVSPYDLLFNALERRLKLDPALYEEVESLKKEIEKNVADTQQTSTNDV